MGVEMSMGILEKIEIIREKNGLTQPQLCEVMNLSLSTLKSMLGRGSSPKYEIVESIAKKWPEYAYWLLTDKTDEPRHTSPENRTGASQEIVLKIIDVVDSRLMTACIVKELFFKHVVFVQSRQNESDLAVLIMVEQDVYKTSDTPNWINAVWIKRGNLNFDSEHGGKKHLKNFRNYLTSVDHDLVINAELYEIDEKIFINIHRSLELRLDDLLQPDESKTNYSRFLSWKKGESPYDN